MSTTRGPGFVGRTRERGVLDGLLAQVRAGESGVLVIRGEAGIGKTALLRHAARQASGFRLAQLTGVEAEMELPFAGIHQLCTTMLDRLDALPAPQRHALGVALGLTAGEVADRFLVGLAVLSLLSAVAEERPLLCLVDDAQWLDGASGQILGLVARRVRAESVAIVVALRTQGSDMPGRDFDGLPVLSLGGLSEDDAHALLASVVTGRLDSRVGDRIVAETRGNPLALLELPRHMTAAELAGGFDLPVTGALLARIEEQYLRRVGELPEATQSLMLLAAAEPLGDATLVLRAGRRLELEAGALAPAEAAELLELGARVRFRHPLVRSAVYRAAPLSSRRRVHEALAEVSDPGDADRRAWHRALAAAEPDEDVATELEHSAGRAQARGGIAATAAFLERAVALTPDLARRRERALTAAAANVQAGTLTTARGLLATAEAGPLDEVQRARIDLLRAQLAFVSSRGTDATPLLLAAARRLEPLDISVARETYVDAFSAALFGARLNGSVGIPEVAEAARAAPRPPRGEPGTADLLLDALVALADDYEAAVPLCREAVKRLSGEHASPRERLRWLWQGCVVALEIWDDEHASSLSDSSVEIARETGTLSELALALSARAPVQVFCGDFAAAAATVSETASVQEATGIRAAPYGALILSAWRGRPRETTELIGTTEREAGARGEGIGLAIGAYARAVLCNGLGRYEEAMDAAVSASGRREVVAENWGLSELVEPATRCGRTDLAADALERLSAKAQAARTDWALGVEARAQALLAESADAERWFGTAIAHLGRTRLLAELARTRLLYGEWLRREGRRIDARAELNIAQELFVSMGMEAFAERARGELGATGEKLRRRIAEARDDLTPQEHQIAELARDGLSNPEIAARLFLSPRTIEWHLRHVFSKLGIRSRRQLGSAFPASESELANARGRD
jgi:DNA-binding CsgD family transcriptional regulator